MRMSPNQCREQADLQRAKALNEPLESRRKIAFNAVKAWEAEALLSEKRASRSRPLNKTDAAIALQFARKDRAGLTPAS
jgi:hypothetical protein